MMNGMRQDAACVLAAAIVTVTLMTAGVARANLLTNGDFEDAGDPITTDPVGWFTFSNADAGTENQAANFDNETGPTVAFMQSLGASDGGSIYQAVNLLAGVEYVLSVDVGRREDHDTLNLAGASYRLVVFNAAFTTEIDGDPDPRGEFAQGDGGSFIAQSLAFFVPTSGLYHVGVRHRGTVGSADFSQLNADNAQLIALPAPAALPAGLAMLAAIGVRRRRR